MTDPLRASPAAVAEPRRRAGWLAALGLVLLVALAWSNALTGSFHLDDEPSIAANPSIRHLGSFGWLTPPAARGETVSGRPVLNLSLALDYAVGGLDVVPYHVTNVAIHALAALALFGLVRRTLRLPGLPPVLQARALPLAWSVAALWAVHPLNTQAVTYIIQRAEALMSLFYLVTLYAALRAATAVTARAAGRWSVAAWLACIAGMATKENMVSAPLAVLLFDRAFLAGGWTDALRRRWALHAGLAASWLVLLALVASTGGNRGGSAGFDVGVGFWSYALTQAPALVRYARLAVWPHPLVFDYGAFYVDHPGDVLPSLLVVLTALAATASALWRYPRVGFVAAVGFAVLAPTSLVPGTLQMIVEHRMYLPLASLIVLAVIAAGRWLPTPTARAALVAVMAGVAALTGLTLARNRVYASELALWADTAAKRPGNSRARNNLGAALLAAGRTAAAEAEFRAAIADQPNHAFAHANLGRVLMTQRRWDAAARESQLALAADPRLTDARVNLGVALTQLGRTEDAIAAYRTAVQEDPTAADARTNLAGLLIDRGQPDAAEPLLRQALAITPTLAEAHLYLGRVCEARDALPQAEAEYREAIRRAPTLASAHLSLANLVARGGDAPTAAAEYAEVLRLDPSSADAHYGRGNLLAAREAYAEAAAEYRAALALDPRHAQALGNLANCELATGAVADAIRHYEQALALRPGDDVLRRNLEIARQMARQLR